MDAPLFFYQGALEFEPRNPIILTNVGMTYLQMGNYETAKGYALLALKSNPECGQAFQILTACHLKDNNSVLAAETLFKSTLDCIDGFTDLLFKSYRDAIYDGINHSNYIVDDFPINDIVLELMYKTAAKYVDTAHINESIDTPTAQVKIKPYPNFGDGERTMRSYGDYWNDYRTKQYQKRDALDEKIKPLEKKIFDKEGEAGILVLMNNLRQYYAYMALEDYYGFQVRRKSFERHCYDVTVARDKNGDIEEYKCKTYAKDISREFDTKYWMAWQKCAMTEMNMWKEKEEKILAMEEQRHASHNNTPSVEQIRATELRYEIQFYTQAIADLTTLYGIAKEYAVLFSQKDKAWYDENKQILEEF